MSDTEGSAGPVVLPKPVADPGLEAIARAAFNKPTDTSAIPRPDGAPSPGGEPPSAAESGSDPASETPPPASTPTETTVPAPGPVTAEKMSTSVSEPHNLGEYARVMSTEKHEVVVSGEVQEQYRNLMNDHLRGLLIIREKAPRILDDKRFVLEKKLISECTTDGKPDEEKIKALMDSPAGMISVFMSMETEMIRIAGIVQLEFAEVAGESPDSGGKPKRELTLEDAVRLSAGQSLEEEATKKEHKKIKPLRRALNALVSAAGSAVVGGVAADQISDTVEDPERFVDMAVNTVNTALDLATSVNPTGAGAVLGALIGGGTSLYLTRDRGDGEIANVEKPENRPDMVRRRDVFDELMRPENQAVTDYLTLKHGLSVTKQFETMYGLDDDGNVIPGSEAQVQVGAELKARDLVGKIKGLRSMMGAREAFLRDLGFKGDSLIPRPDELISQMGDFHWTASVDEKVAELRNTPGNETASDIDLLFRARQEVNMDYLQRAVEAKGEDLDKPMAHIAAGVEKRKNPSQESVIETAVTDRQANERNIATLQSDEVKLQEAFNARGAMEALNNTVRVEFGSDDFDRIMQSIDSAVIAIDNNIAAEDEKIRGIRKEMHDELKRFSDADYLASIAPSFEQIEKIPPGKSGAGKTTTESSGPWRENVSKLTPKAIEDLQVQVRARFDARIADVENDKEKLTARKTKEEVKLQRLRELQIEKEAAEQAITIATIAESEVLARQAKAAEGTPDARVKAKFDELYSGMEARLEESGTQPLSGKLKADMIHQLRGLAYTTVIGEIQGENEALDLKIATAGTGNVIVDEKDTELITEGELVIELIKAKGDIYARAAGADISSVIDSVIVKAAEKEYTAAERSVLQIPKEGVEGGKAGIEVPKGYYEIVNILTGYKDSGADFSRIAQVLPPDRLAGLIADTGMIEGLPDEFFVKDVFDKLDEMYVSGAFTQRDLRRLMSGVIKNLVRETRAKF